jgi:PAS domain S-box-containing protein
VGAGPARRRGTVFLNGLALVLLVLGAVWAGVQGSILLVVVASVCAALVAASTVRLVLLGLPTTRRMTLRLMDTEARYRSLVEGLPAIVYIAEFGADGRWFYVSPQIQKILGFTPEEWLASPRMWFEHLYPEDRDAALGSEFVVLQGGGRLYSEYRMTAKDGRVVWIRDEGDVLPGQDGQPRYLQGVMYDVTEEKEIEARLREALATEKEAGARLRTLNEMQNAFLQAVSHDLRTPLTSILGNALTLERDGGSLSPGVQQDLVSRMAQNARKLHRLLTNLLDLDRLTRGVLEPRRSWIDVPELLDTVVQGCPSEDHDVSVATDGPPRAFVDPAQVERIVENLLVNAIRYTPPGTSIWIGTTAQEDALAITVEDDGPGVDDELKEGIFLPFRQGPNAPRHSPGVGIGLSLVARFAELHGGRAWVEDREGGGVRFGVTLPGAIRQQAPVAGQSVAR